MIKKVNKMLLISPTLTNKNGRKMFRSCVMSD